MLTDPPKGLPATASYALGADLVHLEVPFPQQVRHDTGDTAVTRPTGSTAQGTARPVVATKGGLCQPFVAALLAAPFHFLLVTEADLRSRQYIVLMPLSLQKSIRGHWAAAAELSSFALAVGADISPAGLGDITHSGVPLMHFPTARASPTLQPDLLPAALGVVAWLKGVISGRVPPILHTLVLGVCKRDPFSRTYFAKIICRWSDKA